VVRGRLLQAVVVAGLGLEALPASADEQGSGTTERIRPGDIVVANIGDHSVSVFDGETESSGSTERPERSGPPSRRYRTAACPWASRFVDRGSSSATS